MARILLVEPDNIISKTFVTAFKHAQLDISRVTGAQGAVDFIDKRIPDLILLEVQLVGHNGIEFLYELRSHPDWRSVPVVIVSSIPELDIGLTPESRQKLGIVDYCYKPKTSLRKLIDVSRSHLGKP